MSKKQISDELQRIKRYSVLFHLIWVIVIVSSLFWNLYSNKWHIQENAKSKALAYFENDSGLGIWASKHGGLYSKLNYRNQANPNAAHATIKDFGTPLSDTSTLVNLEDILRKTKNQFSKSQRITAKITSLNPLNTQNKLDNWEIKSLLSFRKGINEISEFTDIKEKNYFRLMRPLIIEESCLECHALQEYDIGNVYGGISIAVPIEPMLNASINEKNRLIAFHISLLIVGLIGINSVSNRFSKKTIENEKSKRILEDLDERLKLTLSATNARIWEWDILNGNVTFNERWSEIESYPLSELVSINIEAWYNLIHPEDAELFDKELERLFAKEVEYYFVENRMQFKADNWSWVQINGKIIDWYNEKPTRMVGIIIDITERNMSKQNIIEREHKYRVIADKKGQMTYAYDIISGNIERTGKLIEALGYNYEDFQKVDISEWEHLVHYDDRVRVIDQLYEAEKNCSDFQIEYRFRNNYNNYVFIEDCGTFLIGPDKRTIKMFGLMKDITEQKLASDKLNESEQKYRSLAENAVDFVWKVDMNLRFLYASPKALYITGYTFDEIMKLNATELFPLEKIDDIRTIINNNIALGKNNKGTTFESVYCHKTGRHIPVEISGTIIWNNVGEPIGISGYTRDISERKVAEDALRESENRFRTTFNQAFDPIFIVKITEGQIPIVFDINDAVTAKLGYTREGSIGKPMNFFLPSEKKEIIFRRINKILNGEHLIFESVHQKKNGSFIPVEISAKKITINEMDYIYIIQRDISEQKKWEKDTLAIQTELKEENKSKDKFFSIISHDLKAPFGTLLSITQLLEENYDEMNDNERKEIIHVARSSSINIYKLLEGLLEWSRVSTGRMSFSPKITNLEESFNQVLLIFIQNAKNKDIKFVNNINSDSSIYADEKMLKTVLRNLLANAIKFTSRGGEITISSRTLKDKVEVSVTDNGIGISQESINKLFRIDVHHTTIGTENESGTGVGLILCKEMVEKNGGNIWVESEIDKGSSFKFTLPLAPPSA